MCRKRHMQGCCLVCFGLGLIIGHCLESWFVCTFGALALLGLGCCVLRQK